MIAPFLNSSLYEILKIASILGMVVCSALLVSLHFVYFNKFFKERTSSMWWLFLVISIIPFLAMVGVFTVLFESKSDVKRVVILNENEPVYSIDEVSGKEIKVVEPYRIIRSFVYRD